MNNRILTALMAFVAVTAVSVSIANAAPGDQGKPFESLTERFIDSDIGDLINRIEKLETIIQVDQDTGDVTIKSENGNLNFDAANGKKVEFKKDASFEGDTVMKKNAKVMGDAEMEGDTVVKKNAKVMGSTELEGDTMAMGTATVSGTLNAETDALIGEELRIRALDGPEGTLYVVVEDSFMPAGPGGDIITARCNDGDVAVGGGIRSDPPADVFRKNGGFQDDLDNEEFGVRIGGHADDLNVTIMALCLSME